jgi:hypothetical protein
MLIIIVTTTNQTNDLKSALAGEKKAIEVKKEQ